MMNTRYYRANLPLLALVLLLTGCSAAVGAANLSASAPTTTIVGDTASAPITAAAVAHAQGTVDPPYLDDRSDAVAVLRSYYNAINRHEYARAYGYWQPGAGTLPAYEQFEQGYSATRSVVLTTGSVQSDAGAGQRYYRVPVVLEAQLSDGSTQTFTGCYDLHLAIPTFQTPPFEPLGITVASVEQVMGGANPSAGIDQLCPTP